jgi:hypothetical protein
MNDPTPQTERGRALIDLVCFILPGYSATSTTGFRVRDLPITLHRVRGPLPVGRRRYPLAVHKGGLACVRERVGGYTRVIGRVGAAEPTIPATKRQA